VTFGRSAVWPGRCEDDVVGAAGGDENAERIGPLELKGIERELVGYGITT
jgi:hypothetical protein